MNAQMVEPQLCSGRSPKNYRKNCNVGCIFDCTVQKKIMWRIVPGISEQQIHQRLQCPKVSARAKRLTKHSSAQESLNTQFGMTV